MKIALVHDYIKEYGGAERVLEVLHEMYPDAPIFTAFYKKNSLAYEKFKSAKIIPSWVQHIPFFVDKLHSPLRFLAPFIWGSFNFSHYDVVISSASWYVTKGFDSAQGHRPIEICYCHTPPRWLYGYKTSVAWQKYWPIKLYGNIVGYFMRKYDYSAAQKVNIFLANSKEVQQRIKKFYGRESIVVYPPVSLPSKNKNPHPNPLPPKAGEGDQGNYYLMVSRLVGGKGLELAIKAAEQAKIRLKIAGVAPGYYKVQDIRYKIQDNIKFLGQVTDEELVKLYSGAKAFLALSQDEDFGITPVEAMLCGTPVIAYYGGGYKETVVDPTTGVFFKEYTTDSLVEAIRRFEETKIDPKACVQQAQKFSKEKFVARIQAIVKKVQN